MEKQIKELLEKLNINFPVEEKGRYWVATLDSYDDFVRTYNKLENSLVVFKNSLLSFMTETEGHIQYETDDAFLVELVAVFDEDDYTLNISKDKDDEDN